MKFPFASERTKSTLLLTAPLLPRGSASMARPLAQRDFNRLASSLSQRDLGVEELLGAEADDVLDDLRMPIDSERLRALLARGLQLANAVDHWRQRSIWVISRGDSEYPAEIAERLGTKAPPVLYCCGDPELLRVAGIAIVGSRDPSQEATEFVRSVALQAGRSSVPVISGGAKGIDASAMRTALDAGGTVVGVLSQHLGRAAVNGANRVHIADGRLLLLSPFDPSAGFNVGNAMGRNKLIYALARAALVGSATLERGGTWGGAVEQLRGDSPIPLYVPKWRCDEAIEALHGQGAEFWPERADVRQLVCQSAREATFEVHQRTNDPSLIPLLDHASRMLARLDRECSSKELAEYLGVTPGQMKVWLPDFLEAHVLELSSKRPVRYRVKSPSLPL